MAANKSDVAAGKYRTSISVERNRPTLGESGGKVDFWIGYVARRCKIRPAGVRDQIATETQNVVLISHVVELRRDSATEQITQDMRVRVLSRLVTAAPRVLHIEAVVDADDCGRELHLRCSERSVAQ